MLSALWGVLGLLATAFALIAGRWLGKKEGRREGAQEAEQKAKEADHDQAQHIRRRAEAARERFGGDPVERLREAGKLRSEKPDD